MNVEQKTKNEAVEELMKEVCRGFVLEINEIERFFEVSMPMVDCELEAIGETLNTDYTYKVVLLRKLKEQTWEQFTNERLNRNKSMKQ